MRQVLKEIPEGAATDPQYAAVQVAAYQSKLGQISGLCSSLAKNDPLIGMVGSFDAIATARLWARFYSAMRRNALRDWLHQDSDPDQVVRDAGQGLPRDPDPRSFWHDVPDDPEAERDLYDRKAPPPPIWSEWLYQIRMVHTPNSYGRLLVSAIGNANDRRRHSVEFAISHEGNRAILALLLYARLHNGNLPSALGALVKEGYLTSIPMDFFTCAPMHYDPRRRVVYSLGSNGHAVQHWEFPVDQPVEVSDATGERERRDRLGAGGTSRVTKSP